MFAKPLYKMSGRELEAAAKTGRNPEALLELSTMVAQGWRGLDGDEDRALELEKMAASLGHPRALCRLGDRFSRGSVVDQNDAEARLWWRRAAEAGDLGAMSNLIDLRESDDPRERAEGEHWLRLAASRGQPHALHIVNGGTAGSMDDFAKLSLEQMAGAAPAATGTELSWERDGIRASIAQVNDLAGIFVERMRAHFFDVHTQSTIDHEDADFPQPDLDEVESLVAEKNTIEVMIYAGRLHLQITLIPAEAKWSVGLSSYEPHPSTHEQQWLIAQLVETARQIGLRV
ncbi:MAG: tetratricopeptide repeat protein [Kofleriaceae bacterium]